MGAMEKHIFDEAKRCLNCKNPRCSKGCPVNTPVNLVIEKFLHGKILEAGEILYENNPLSVICSMVCPHEKQCEGSCIVGIKGKSVEFGAIEHYISDYYLNFIKPEFPISKDKKVALIGSGPAGITIAMILASKGYDITIFEAHDKIGGVLRYGIPEFRLPKVLLDRLKVKLVEMGIKIRPNTLIGPVLTIDNLFEDGYKAVFIGTGVWKPKKLGIKGETLGHVHYAIDYLKNPDVYNLGDKACIIGAGNVAMDAARTAIRKGVREVSIIYRAGEDKITAEKTEVAYAKLDGVKFELYKSPVEINDEGIICINTRDAEKGDVTNTELIKASSVIIAISQGPRDIIVSSTNGISIDIKGLVKTDNFGKTTREGVFASGDVVTGAKTVVEAVKLSKKVAEAIDEYVRRKYYMKTDEVIT
jgi:glutamate synthase (NADPH) small chain